MHIPFCVRKCNYCDFLSMSVDESVQKAYVNQLIEEIRMQAKNLNDFQISTIFFGGGTPSLLSGLQISNIMSTIYEGFAVEADAEITIECNPGTVDEDKLVFYKESGINRLSFGLQSTYDDELKLLGRIHTYDDFLKSYQLSRQVGFENINIDIMSSLPHQTLDKWKNTVRRVAMLKPEHISAYSLIIEKGTPFFESYGDVEGRRNLPDDATDREMYYATKEILSEYELERYEISNYAKKGYECRHNIGYWTGVPYLGVGLGASSYLLDHRYHNITDLNTYISMDMHKDMGLLYQDILELSQNDKMAEFMFLGLRMMNGVSGHEFMDRFGLNMFNVYDAVIRKNKARGLLKYEPPYISLTDKGIDVSNTVMSDFLI